MSRLWSIAVVAGLLWPVCGDAVAETRTFPGRPVSVEPSFRPVRIGACAGLATDCVIAGIKLEIAAPFIAVNVAYAMVALSASVKVYPTKGLYAFYGVSAAIGMTQGYNGFGAGADVYLSESKRLLLQPSVSLAYLGVEGSGDGVKMGVSLAVMAAL